MPENLKNVEGQFKEYEIHHKIIPRSRMARIAFMAKKDEVNIQRVEDIEDTNTSAMWFKLKLPSKTIMMAPWYRQWFHLEDVAANHTEGVEGQIEHIQSMKNQL